MATQYTPLKKTGLTLTAGSTLALDTTNVGASMDGRRAIMITVRGVAAGDAITLEVSVDGTNWFVLAERTGLTNYIIDNLNNLDKIIPPHIRLGHDDGSSSGSDGTVDVLVKHYPTTHRKS